MWLTVLIRCMLSLVENLSGELVGTDGFPTEDSSLKMAMWKFSVGKHNLILRKCTEMLQNADC